MKICFLLLGTSLSLIPSLTFAQCVATQDCETLGYTETSCNGGKGVKCPFGNKWACLTSEEECLNLACDKLGFTYTCTGSGEQGVGNACNGKYQSCSCDSTYKYTCTGPGQSGSGTACGGKYTACTCDSSYKYTCSGTGYSGGSGTACRGKYTSCTCTDGYEWNDSNCQPLNGAQRNVYYCNGKAVGIRLTGMSFYVAMRDLGKLTWTNANSQSSSYVFCGSLKGTLPTSDQLSILYSSKLTINSFLTNNGGTALRDDYYWSSSDWSTGGHDAVNISNGGTYLTIDTKSYYARPILTSW